jgi:hypothetical protein
MKGSFQNERRLLNAGDETGTLRATLRDLFEKL